MRRALERSSITLEGLHPLSLTRCGFTVLVGSHALPSAHNTVLQTWWMSGLRWLSTPARSLLYRTGLYTSDTPSSANSPKNLHSGLFTSAVSICCYYFCGTLKGENLQLFYGVFKYKHNKSPSEANQICFYLEMFILFWVILYGMILFHWLKFTLTSVSPQNGSRHSRDFCHFSFSLDRSPFLMFCRIHGCRSWSMRRESGKWQRNLFSWFSQHLSLRRQNVRSSRSWVQPMRCLRHSSCDG